MATSENVEHATLVAVSDKVMANLSIDPLSVAKKLFSKGLISQNSLDSLQITTKTDQQRASELVQLLISLVDIFPVNFEAFLEVIDEHFWLEKVAKLIREKHDELVKVRSHTPNPDVSATSAKSNQDFKTFPYLNVPALSENKRERLLARLRVESDKIRGEFAILVNKTRESLTRQGISCEDLKLLIRFSNKNKLFHLLKEENDVTDLFYKLCDYLSFFDYELISLMIEQYCPMLVNEMEAYQSVLKTYCLRRVVEVPVDAFKNIKYADETILFVKCDESFESIILKDVKDYQSRLSLLLETDIYLLRIEEGCTELVFNTMCPISPLTESQRSQLSEMGILKLYSVHYQKTKSNVLSSEKPAMGRSSGKLSLMSDVSVQAGASDEPSSKPVQYSPVETVAQYNEPPNQPAQAVAAEFELSEDAIMLIAKVIEGANKVEELAKVLKMSRNLKEIGGNGRLLLKMWQKVAASRDFLQRPHLMYYLDVIGLGHFHPSSLQSALTLDPRQDHSLMKKEKLNLHSHLAPDTETSSDAGQQITFATST